MFGNLFESAFENFADDDNQLDAVVARTPSENDLKHALQRFSSLASSTPSAVNNANQFVGANARNFLVPQPQQQRANNRCRNSVWRIDNRISILNRTTSRARSPTTVKINRRVRQTVSSTMRNHSRNCSNDSSRNRSFNRFSHRRLRFQVNSKLVLASSSSRATIERLLRICQFLFTREVRSPFVLFVCVCSSTSVDIQF
jgi:hypothetical protein